MFLRGKPKYDFLYVVLEGENQNIDFLFCFRQCKYTAYRLHIFHKFHIYGMNRILGI